MENALCVIYNTVLQAFYEICHFYVIFVDLLAFAFQYYNIELALHLSKSPQVQRVSYDGQECVQRKVKSLQDRLQRSSFISTALLQDMICELIEEVGRN